jgi:hypothetical protein
MQKNEREIGALQQCILRMCFNVAPLGMLIFSAASGILALLLGFWRFLPLSYEGTDAQLSVGIDRSYAVPAGMKLLINIADPTLRSTEYNAGQCRTSVISLQISRSVGEMTCIIVVNG